MRVRSRDHQRFTELFAECSTRVYAFARRQTDASGADDVVADTFLVAWRRLPDVPVDDPLPWLLVVARNTIANRRRTTARSARLTLELMALERLAAPVSSADSAVLARQDVLSALAALTDLEREAVLLVAWDGLTAVQAATVAGCSPHAFTVRLQRARQRLHHMASAHLTDLEQA